MGYPSFTWESSPDSKNSSGVATFGNNILDYKKEFPTFQNALEIRNLIDIAYQQGFNDGISKLSADITTLLKDNRRG